MSMQCYPEYGFGLVVTGDEIGKLVEKNGCEDEFELQEKIGNACRIYDDEFEGKAFSGSPSDVSAEDENMLVIWAQHQPDAYKAVYGSPEEAAHEFEENYSEFFPLGFDYVAHLGYFQACMYC